MSLSIARTSLAKRLLGASLALLAPATMQSSAPRAEPQAQRISGPVAHDNVTLYFVHGTSALGPVPQSLQEAMAKGSVIVHETGNVQKLEIENNGNEPVFVQFGDIVKGGQQDRVLTVSLLIEPKSGRIPIGAYCVEQGRWAARGKEDVKRFAVSEAMMPSREAKLAMAKPRDNTAATAGAGQNAGAQPRPSRNDGNAMQQRVQGGGEGRGGGQGEVWSSVSKVQEQLGAALSADVKSDRSRTSLQLALENDKLKTAQSAYLAALEPAGLNGDDIVGVVVAVNGRLSGADIYPSNGLFKKMWPKIVRTAATEALSSRTQALSVGGTSAVQPAQPATAPLSIEAITAFLSEADKAKGAERDVGAMAKIETRDSDKALRVEARTAKGAFVHKNYLAK